MGRRECVPGFDHVQDTDLAALGEPIHKRGVPVPVHTAQYIFSSCLNTFVHKFVEPKDKCIRECGKDVLGHAFPCTLYAWSMVLLCCCFFDLTIKPITECKMIALIVKAWEQVQKSRADHAAF